MHLIFHLIDNFTNYIMNLFYCFLISLLSINLQDDGNVRLQEEYAAARSRVSSVISENGIENEISGSEYLVFMMGDIGNMLIIISYDSQFKIYRYFNKVMSVVSYEYKKNLPEIVSLFEFADRQKSPLIYDVVDKDAEYNPFYYYLGIFDEYNKPMLELNRHSMKAFKQKVKPRKLRKIYPLTPEQTSCIDSLFIGYYIDVYLNQSAD